MSGNMTLLSSHNFFVMYPKVNFVQEVKCEFTGIRGGDVFDKGKHYMHHHWVGDPLFPLKEGLNNATAELGFTLNREVVDYLNKGL